MENPLIYKLLEEVEKPICKFPVWFFHENSKLVYHYTEKGKYTRSTLTRYIPILEGVTKNTHRIEFHSDNEGQYVKLYLIDTSSK